MSTGGWTAVDAVQAQWLAELDPDGGWTGYDAGDLPDAVWLLHAMYEWEAEGTQTTHHELRQSLLAAGLVEPDLIGGIDADALGAVDTGGVLGRSQHPGAGWRRLRWSVLAARTGEPVIAENDRPSFTSLPGAHPKGSWPASIEPPGEGSLDREGWSRLVELLILFSPAGPDTECFAYFSPGQNPEIQQAHVVRGRLRDAVALYDHEFGSGSPANLWPADRSWVLWSDWDLWGTKVSGPSALIGLLLSDEELEAVRLPWA